MKLAFKTKEKNPEKIWIRQTHHSEICYCLDLVLLCLTIVQQTSKTVSDSKHIYENVLFYYFDPWIEMN